MKDKPKKQKYKYTKIALNEIKFTGSSKWQWCISCIVGFFVSIIISYGPNTIIIMSEIVDKFNAIALVFIAMVLGAYALFQALLNNRLVLELANCKTLLEDSNIGFLALILLYWADIIINIFLSIVLNIIPINFSLFNNYMLDSLLCFITILIYISFNMRIFIEIRNFAINLYKVFIAHNKVALLEEMEKIEESEKLNKILKELEKLKK